MANPLGVHSPVNQTAIVLSWLVICETLLMERMPRWTNGTDEQSRRITMSKAQIIAAIRRAEWLGYRYGK